MTRCRLIPCSSCRSRSAGILALATLLLIGLAACNPQGNKLSTTAPYSPTAAYVDASRLSVTKTTGRVLTFTGGPTGALISPAFRLKPDEHIACIWQGRAVGASPSLSLTLAPVQGSQMGSDEVTYTTDLSAGTSVLGIASGEWAGEARLHISATNFQWGVHLIVGGRSLVTYQNSALGFSLTFDPLQAALTTHLLSMTEARRANAEGGLRVSVFSPPGGYVLSLEATKSSNSQGTPRQVESLVSEMQGKAVGVPSRVTLDHISGFKLRFQQGSSRGTAYIFTPGHMLYRIIALHEKSKPTAERALARLLAATRLAQYH